MALYSATSPSVNNTSTRNESLATNHHMQPEKRSPLIDDNSLPTKRKRLSLTMTEPNVTLDTLLPSPCPLLASDNESTRMPILEQTEEKPHNVNTVTATPTHPEIIPLSAKLHNDSQHQNTLVSTEGFQHDSTQQKQETSVSIRPTSSSPSNQPLPLPQKQVSDTLIETSQPSSTQQQDTWGATRNIETSLQSSTPSQETDTSVSPPLSSSQLPPISQQQQDTVVATHATETTKELLPQQDKTTITLPPPLDQPHLTSQQKDISTTTETSHQPHTPTIQPPTRTTKNANPVIQPQPSLSEGRSKRKRKPVEYNVKEWETFKQILPRRKAYREGPRWYTQSYMMFLALREQPDHCLSRPDLIRAALAMDEKISKERNLPKVFQSRTPANSASAILTTNSDRYYISYKPEGSRSLWFRLAYTPGNFDHAYGEYRKWMDKLINHDWLFCFGVPLENSVPMTKEEIDALVAGSTTALSTVNLKHSSTDNNNDSIADTSSTTPPSLNDSNNDDSNNNTVITDIHTSTTTSGDSNNNTIDTDIHTSSTTSLKDDGDNGSAKQNDLIGTENGTTTKLNQVQKIHQPMYRLDQLDLTNVPKKWQDIVRVDTSTIPNSGQGLFAVRELPYNTPLGFYFGVPMTECEFDSIKENVGRASEYSIKYRRTVLDATDEHGEPYTLKGDDDDAPQRLCPFHYMNEAKDIGMANILFVEGYVVNQVICWSKRLIRPGEELLVWYGTDVNRYWKDDSDQQASP